MASRNRRLLRSSSIDKLTFISQHPFFIDLPIDIRKRAVNYVKSRHYDIGERIFSKGDHGDCLFVVYRGIVKIDAQSYEGKELVFTLIKEGECFGEIAALDGLPRTASASAFTNCELMIVDRRDLALLMETYPPLTSRLVQILCSRLRRTTQQVEILKFIDLAARLARTLLELSID